MSNEVKVTSLSGSWLAVIALIALMESCSTLTAIKKDVRAIRCVSQPASTECKVND